MKGYTPGVASRRTDEIPYVEIWEQPAFWRVVALAYHLWEKLTEPIMRYVSRWHRSVFQKSVEYTPLLNRRDIRCHRLSRKSRDMLAIIYITREQYNIITGKALKIEEPRHEIKEPIQLAEE